MGNGRVRLLRAIPGTTSLRPIVRDFCRKGQGAVTAFSDSLLPLCRQEVDEDSLIDVLPFSELVCRYLELSGEESLRLAGSGHVLAAIAEACRSLPDDSSFRRSARFPGFHKALLETTQELHEWGLLWEDVASLSDQVEGRLADKLRTMATVDREVHRMLGMLGRQTHGQQMRSCLEATPELDGEFERILVFAGSDEAPLKVQWLRWAAEHGTDVTVVVDRHASDGRIFRGAAHVVSQFGVEPVDIGEGNRLLKNLFASESHPGPAHDVSIVSTADPLAEAEWALRTVQGEWDKAGIYVRNLENYAPLIEAAAKRLGVPIRIARRAPLLTNAFARMTLTILQFVASEDVRTLGPAIQSSYIGLNGSLQTRLVEGLREAHRMRGMQWQALRTWAESNESSYPWLLKVLDWRQTAVGESTSLANWGSKLRTLIGELPWNGPGDGGGEYARSRDIRALTQIQRVLAGHASVERVTDAPPVSLRGFVDHCQKLWEASDVSIPSADVGVCVSAHAEGLEDSETVVVMGMLEGVFPRRRTEDPILTDREREAVSSLLPKGTPPLRTSHDIAQEERDVFYRVCASSKRKLVFSYPLADDQRDNVPAFYLELIKRTLEGVEELDRPRSVLAPPIAICECDADRKLREALESERETALPVTIAGQAMQEALRRDPAMPVSPVELRDASLCSFQYIARHRLRLRPKRTTTRWARLRELPQLASLPKQATANDAERALLDALEAELDTLYPEIPEWELRLLRAGGRRLIADWVRREFRARAIWPKNLESVELNVGFGQHGTRERLWNGVQLEGVIPAVSDLDGVSIAHLYSGATLDAERITDADRLYLGAYMAALLGRDTESGIELESMSGKRTLFLLTRSGVRGLTNDVQHGLSIVDLATTDDTLLSKKIFYEEVKRLVAVAAQRIREGRVEALQGEHCDWCDYGEICRRNRNFGEEDSPFGMDRVAGDV